MRNSLLLLLDPAPLMMAGLFALLLAFAHRAGLYGIPVGVILTSWFFKYGFALLDAVITGEREPPVLSYEIIHPLTGKHLLARTAVIPLGVVLPLVLPGCGVLMMFVVYFGAQMAVMAAFALGGALVFARRLELGIETLTPDERRDRREQRDFEAERAAMLERAYALLRLKRRPDAWREFETWLHTHARGDDTLAQYHALFTATSSWDDPALPDRLANAYLDRLLAAGETGMAVDTLAQRLSRNPAFRVATPATAVRLVELTRLAGHGALGRQIQVNAGNVNSTAGI